jgi:hypothetical protein
MSLSLCLLPIICLYADPAPPVKDPKLRDEILQRAKKDQDARFQLIEAAAGKTPKASDVEAVQMIDADNRAWLKAVVEKQGWPGKSLVGEEGAHDAWLIVQHADADLPFQKKCLELLKAAVKKGDASGIDLAYLTDRVLSGEGKKQLYGTQLIIVDGKFAPKPVEDEKNLDQRRKELGLEPMAQYIESATKVYKLDASKK